MNPNIEILDSTLRDGAQSEGISYSIQDKLCIMRALDELGVAYIEAGNPGANPKDAAFFAVAACQAPLRHARLIAFGCTRRKHTRPADDATLQPLLDAGTSHVILFGKSSPTHVTRILGTSFAENLAMIYDTIAYLTDQGKTVLFDAEHFFDGYREDRDYALSTLAAARRAGAHRLVLCDTNGGSFPEDIAAATATAFAEFGDCIGIHCHNDTGCAVASSQAAVRAGARHVQGTLAGIGERCGNANLATIIANLQGKLAVRCIPPENLKKLTRTVRHLCEISNISLPRGAPYVGYSAFAHKAGMHADAAFKLSSSFEHIPPETVGNLRRFPTSEMAGRSAILSKLHAFAPTLQKDSPQLADIMGCLKRMEKEGWQFESADASFELMARRQLGLFSPHFDLEYYNMDMEQPSRGEYSALATIKIRVGQQSQLSCAEGDGPVHALDCALRRALEVFYPCLSTMHLTDFKVRVLDPDAATGARVRVLMTSTDGERIWSTVAASTNIIEACWLALVDAFEYMLL